MPITEQLQKAQLIWIQQRAEARKARFDNFLDLVKQGESAEVAAARLGVNVRALMRQAYRWKRRDIVAYLSSADYRARHGL